MYEYNDIQECVVKYLKNMHVGGILSFITNELYISKICTCNIMVYFLYTILKYCCTSQKYAHVNVNIKKVYNE